jgi:hypothetical protein
VHKTIVWEALTEAHNEWYQEQCFESISAFSTQPSWADDWPRPLSYDATPTFGPYPSPPLETSSLEAEAQPKRRGPGRPPKHPKKDPNAPKKSVGRPPGSKDNVQRLRKGTLVGKSKAEQKKFKEELAKQAYEAAKTDLHEREVQMGF